VRKARKEISVKQFLIPVLVLSGSIVYAQTGSSRPDLTGIWNSATATPLERPVQLRDKAFLTKEEAEVFERQAASRNEEAPAGAQSRNVGTYNTAWREFGVHVVKTMRTSIVVDPPDGRLPALTPQAAAAKKRRSEALKNPSSAEDLGLQDQCLAFPTAIPPMTPYSYNSNYQFLLTGDTLMIYVEMPHETRVIPLDGRPHAPAGTRSWLGDSVGHWEGNTLVVDTTNFNDANGYYGDAGGMFGWDRNMHVVERFSLMDKETLLYQFSVDDPTAFTKPWKGELTMSRSGAPIYEYACHEGNYALPNLMKAYLSPVP
jgi:hypothetical protein